MSISRRGDSWRARYYGPDGRQRNKSFKRKSDAERWLAQQRSLMAQGDWTDPTPGPVSPSVTTRSPGSTRAPTSSRRPGTSTGHC
jgi:hypothetical protein